MVFFLCGLMAVHSPRDAEFKNRCAMIVTKNIRRYGLSAYTKPYPLQHWSLGVFTWKCANTMRYHSVLMGIFRAANYMRLNRALSCGWRFKTQNLNHIIKYRSKSWITLTGVSLVSSPYGLLYKYKLRIGAHQALFQPSYMMCYSPHQYSWPPVISNREIFFISLTRVVFFSWLLFISRECDILFSFMNYHSDCRIKPDLWFVASTQRLNTYHNNHVYFVSHHYGSWY
jgi:hypothetical protein